MICVYKNMCVVFIYTHYGKYPTIPYYTLNCLNVEIPAKNILLMYVFMECESI